MNGHSASMEKSSPPTQPSVNGQNDEDDIAKRREEFFKKKMGKSGEKRYDWVILTTVALRRVEIDGIAGSKSLMWAFKSMAKLEESDGASTGFTVASGGVIF